MCSPSTKLASAFCIAVLVLSAQNVGAAQEWTEFRNERYGFTFLYPATIFNVERTAEAGDGQLFRGIGSDAQLLVGALTNSSRHTPAEYQNYVERNSYAEYRVDYRRLGGSWFVLSGEGNGKVFYEKVMFTCGGRLINSFAMIYRTDERHLFDPIVERIEDSFRPARDCDRAGSADRSRASGLP